MTVFAPGHVGSDASNLLLLLLSSSSFLLLLLWDSASSARNLSLSLSRVFYKLADTRNKWSEP